MFPKKRSALLLSIFFCVSALAQDHYYVYDPDKFVYVREEPGVGSKVADTLYVLQIVKTGVEKNGWMEIIKGEESVGWAHKSRLRPMPPETHETLAEYDRRYSGWYRAFIAGTDTPHIAIGYRYMTNPYPLPVKGDYPEKPINLIIDFEDCDAVDLAEDKIIWRWGIPSWPQLFRVYGGRLILKDNYAEYAFVRNGEGVAGMLVTPTYSFAPRDYPPAEIEQAISKAEIFKRECEGKSPQEIWEIAFDINNDDDHEFLKRLRSSYYRGDPRGKELYLRVLFSMRSDGAGWEGLGAYQYELWIYNNAGFTELGKLNEYYE